MNADWEQSKMEMIDSSKSGKYRKEMDYEWMRIKERYGNHCRPKETKDNNKFVY